MCRAKEKSSDGTWRGNIIPRVILLPVHLLTERELMNSALISFTSQNFLFCYHKWPNILPLRNKHLSSNKRPLCAVKILLDTFL